MPTPSKGNSDGDHEINARRPTMGQQEAARVPRCLKNTVIKTLVQDRLVEFFAEHLRQVMSKLGLCRHLRGESLNVETYGSVYFVSVIDTV